MTEKQHYLPKWTTTDEACAWLEEQTGESWPIARLLDSGLTPSVWLEYSPEAPKEIFGDRYEGFLAPLLFGGDTNRMANTRSGLLTMTRLPNGLLSRFSPGIPFGLSELRYSAKDLAKLVQGHQTGQETPATSQAKDGRQTRKREKQIQTIEATARALNYDPLDIPEGGRAAIKRHCLEHHLGLFTDSGFGHAWKAANRQDRIRIHRKERYIAR